MGRTRPDLYQLDTTGGVDGDTIVIVGGVPTWQSGGSVHPGDLVVQDVPSGAIDGANTIFGLTYPVASGATPALYLDGIRLMQGASDDFTLGVDSQTITMLYPPASGQNFFADYRK